MNSGTINYTTARVWTSCLGCGQPVSADIPHTCPPKLKELTDVEIIKEALDFGFLTDEDLTIEWAEYTQEFIGCVRAILRKAQEK